MAELKFNDFQYDIDYYTTDQATAYEPAAIPVRPEVVPIPLSPARRIRRIGKVERIVVMVAILMVVFSGVLMIRLRASIAQKEQHISTIQAEIALKQKDILSLEQEKAELSKSDRIMKIAEDEGLSIQDDNLRKVK